MSRAPAAALALAAVASVGLVAAAGGVSRAAAADCAWQAHSKRVVKRVKRHGQVRKVVRSKRWWSCDPLAEPPAAGIPPASLPSPTPTPAPEAEPPPRRISVKAEDATPEAFTFTLSRLYVVAGEVTVELNNKGQDAHNLNIRREGGEETPLEVGEAEPGENRAAHLNLPAGTYQLYCSLPQHEEWGMSVNLEVRSG